MILGISGSPRADGITANAVKYMLSQFDGETQYISLSGKRINGCISCMACTHNNKCAVKDDFPEIAEAMQSADAIIFGIPNYYGMPNALSHALLERCFTFRHREVFGLEGKQAVLFATGFTAPDKENPVLSKVDYFMRSNRVNVLSAFDVKPYHQCYFCDYGTTCKVGSVVGRHGVLEKITEDILPPIFCKQPDSMAKCDEAVRLIKKAIR